MTAAWVAGTVRARALVRRRLGVGGARALVSAGSFQAALGVLARSSYGHSGDARELTVGPGVRPGDDPAAAAHGVAATLLWNVRVLAGWLPSRGSDLLRVLVGWFEIANIEEHLRSLPGHGPHQPYRLGSLATAWPRLAATASAEELRAALIASPWRDPGGVGPRDIQIGLRMAWADRVCSRVPQALPWALGGAALLLARELLARGEPLSEPARAAARRTLGAGVAASATTLGELRASLPYAARWALEEINDPAELWRAEARWWRRLHSDSVVLAARSGFGEEPVVGAVGLLAHDAWLVTAALAGVGRDPDAVEAFTQLAEGTMEHSDALA